MPFSPPIFRAGAAVSAGALTELSEQVGVLSSPRGVVGRSGEPGTALRPLAPGPGQPGALALGVECLDALVTGVRLDGALVDPATAPASYPEQITYDVVACAAPSVTLTGRLPAYGRPFRGRDARLLPAKLDSVCWILRRRRAVGSGGERRVEITSELWIAFGGEMGEVIAPRPCGR